MASKYDVYWAGRLREIHAAVDRVVAGQSARVELAGLRDIGERRSWYGVAEVRGREVVHASMAHATSLGRVIAASGICVTSPAATFRFAVSAAGDALTISTATGGPARLPATAAGPGKHAGAPGAAAARGLSADGSGREPAGTAAGRFYQALDQLADIVGGPRLLRECHGSDGWPQHGVYFFFEPGEARADGSGRVVRVGTHALTATSQATLWGRLRQHRGHLTGRHAGGGNHRASVFRRHVGAALIIRDGLPAGLLDSWLDRHAARPEISQSGLWNVDHIRHHREPGFPGRLEQLTQRQQ